MFAEYMKLLSLCTIICPIAIAYSTGQIINSACLCHSVSVCLSVCSHSHGRISWSIFAKSDTEVTIPKSKNDFVGVNIAPPLPYFAPPPKKNNFWGVSRRFQALFTKKYNLHIIESTASILTKFCTVIKTTKCLCGWSKRAHHKFKMADSRHLGKIEKSPYRHDGLTDRHEIWHDGAGWPSWPFRLSDFRPEVEIRQLHTCSLKNDIAGHDGLNTIQYNTKIT